MASKTTDCLDNICPLCNETITYYAVGSCDHSICHVCSTRMRVLFEQTYCAICRSQMPKVLFTRKSHKFQSINTHHFLVHRTAKIYFETDAVKTTFDKLLEHCCQICHNTKTLPSFNLLKDHMRREHNLHCCDLCVKHLKIFSSERKFYDRKKLAEHRRVGDTDDTSHRGHPLCEFCDERYLDNDELVKHLRKDHYYCHFCETDGISNQFFGDYSFLREHFAEQHYLCEEDECIDIQFTNAFRSEIDLKAHKATAHSRNLRRMAARQARTLDIDFNLAPRPRAMHSRRRDVDHGVVSAEDFMEVHEDYHRHKGGQRGRGHRHQDRNAENMQRAINMSLSTMETESRAAAKTSQPATSITRNSDNFPTLAQQSTLTQGTAAGLVEGHSTTMANKLALASNFSVQDGGMAQEDFPSLGKGRGSRRPTTAPMARAWSQKQPVRSHVVAAVQNSSAQKSEPQEVMKLVPQKQARSAIAWDAPVPKPEPTGGKVVGSSIPYETDRNFPSLSSIGDSLMLSTPPSADGPVKQSAVPMTKYNKETDKRTSSATNKDAKGRGRSESAGVNSSTVNKKIDALSKKSDQMNKKKDMINKKNYHENQKNDTTKKSDTTNKDNSDKQKREQKDGTKPDLGSNNNKVDMLTKKTDTVQGAGNVKKQEVSSKKKQDCDTSKQPAATSSTMIEKDFPVLSAPKSQDGTTWLTKKGDITKQDTNSKKKQSTNNKPSGVKSIEKDFPVLGAPENHDGTSWLTKSSSKFDTTNPGKHDRSKQGDSLTQKQQGANKSASWTNAMIVSSEDFPSHKYSSLASVVGGGAQPNLEEMEEFTVIKGVKGKKKKKQVMEDLCRKHKFVVKVDAADSEEEEEIEISPPPAGVEPCPEEGSGVRSKKQKKKGKQNDNDKDGPLIVDSDRKDQRGNVVIQTKKIAPTSLKDCADSVLVQPVTGTNGVSATIKVAPPPGFRHQPKTKAPPGFSAGSVPSMPQDLLLVDGDFASSTDNAPTNGHDSQPSTSYNYFQPENSVVRNQKLIADIHTLLDYGGDDKFGKFKKCSNEFRQGEITAEDYDSRCIMIMGKECFDEVFPELLVLLPDIDRQQELLIAHYGTKKKGKSGRRATHTHVAYNANSTKSNFYTCHQCRQVTMVKEKDAHLRHHDTEADFPSLQAASGRGLYGMGSAGRIQNLTS